MKSGSLFLAILLTINIFSYGNDKSINNEAEILALEYSGDLIASETLCKKIENDLAIIRRNYPQIKSIGHLPRWLPGQILILLKPEKWESFKNNTYQELNDLNQQYDLKEARIITESIYCILLTFSLNYHPERLAEIYKQLDGINSAEANGIMGDGDKIYIQGSGPDTYIFRAGWGDCPSGCIYEHLWEIHIDNENIATLVKEWGDPLTVNNKINTAHAIKKNLLNVNNINLTEKNIKISFRVPQSSFMSLKVYTIHGKEVCTVAQGFKEPNTYTTYFNSNRLPSNSYVLVFQLGNNIIVNKKIFLIH